MALVKISEAFKAGADWVSATVRELFLEQVARFVDTVSDINDNDLERARWIFLRANGSYYRLDLSSGAEDDGDGVLRDSVGRRYIKIPVTGTGSGWNVQVADLAGRAAYNAQSLGFKVLVSNVGDGRAAVYTKTGAGSGDWSAAAYWTGVPGSDGVQSSDGSVTDIVALTQSEYDLLSPPNESTWYIITD